MSTTTESVESKAIQTANSEPATTSASGNGPVGWQAKLNKPGGLKPFDSTRSTVRTGTNTAANAATQASQTSEQGANANAGQSSAGPATRATTQSTGQQAAQQNAGQTQSTTQTVASTTQTTQPVPNAQSAEGATGFGGGKPLIEVTDEDALIALPGEKPKTVRQLNFERNQAKDIHRQLSDIDFKRRELERERHELEEEKTQLRAGGSVSRVQVGTSQASSTQQATQAGTQSGAQTATDSDQMPQPPAGAVDGDPEWEVWKAQLQIWTARQIQKPALEKETRKEQDEQAQRDRDAQMQRTFRTNDARFTESMRHLPFDYNGLPEATQKQVFAQIRAEGLTRGIDISDRAQMGTKELSPLELEVMVKGAFPRGTLAPGYERQTAAVQNAPALEALQKLADDPVVQKQSPQPLHTTSTGGASAPALTRGEEIRANRTRTWMDKLGPAQE